MRWRKKRLYHLSYDSEPMWWCYKQRKWLLLEETERATSTLRLRSKKRAMKELRKLPSDPANCVVQYSRLYYRVWTTVPRIQNPLIKALRPKGKKHDQLSSDF